jgi:hypothetical protein
MDGEFLTTGEFGRFRADFTQWQAELRRQMFEGFQGTHTRLDDINGRGRKNSEAIAVLESEVRNLTDHGCAQYDEHRKVLTEVVVPSLEKRSTPWSEWHPAAKVGAAGGGFAVLAALMEIFGRILAHFGV